MAGKTIERIGGRTIGRVGLGMHGDTLGSVKQQVYDGDTIEVRALGDFGIRFLGIDTPEKKIPLPGTSTFTSLSDDGWNDFLSDPFAVGGSLSPSPFSGYLTNYLQEKTGPGMGTNHKRHADDAEDELEKLIQNDLNEMGVSNEDFGFFLRFAYEIMDGYGRFLCYINRNQPDANVPSPRPSSYNVRILQSGMALPYFIWPNINPWRSSGSVVDAVIQPGSAKTTADNDPELSAGRQAVSTARQNHQGIFDTSDPLVFEAFEIRYMSKGYPPFRWVIDLSKNDNVLIHPENYYTILSSEDRLFIPPEFVPLFVEAGWQMQNTP